LRVCAVVGQFIAVLTAVHAFDLPIDENALFAGIAALAAFDVFVWWRLRQAWPVHETEVVLHLTVDTAVLCYLLYLTGGTTNPFVSLYIVPIAVAAMTLSSRHLAAAVLIACLAYIFVLLHHVPLPEVAMRMTGNATTQDLDLHTFGMAVNFAIRATLLSFFIWRLTRELRWHQESTQRERERSLRDEGIIAIAIQAASAAHELNTPLSTIRTLVGELRREHPADTPFGEDLALLAQQTERCRGILRELAQIGSAQQVEQAQMQTLPTFVADCAQCFRLLRPAVELKVTLGAPPQPAPRRIVPVLLHALRNLFSPAPRAPAPASKETVAAGPGAALETTAQSAPLRIVPALRHAIVNLLNNAADASALTSSAKVDFTATYAGPDLVIEIRDYGPGLPQAVREAGGTRFASGKRDGLGLGLALANATVERFHGTLHADSPPQGGTITRLCLPLVALRR
jgi:two-component system sensor histidine kinase RegB